MPKKKTKTKKKAVKAKKAAPKKKAVKKVKAKPKKAAKSAARPAKPKPAAVLAKPGYRPAANEKLLGEVEDYFSRIGVIALTVKESLAVGQTIHVHGHTTDLTQRVESMEINHEKIQKSEKGGSVGIKVSERCRKGDQVFRVD